MKRRGFLGLMGGAVAAGPGMVKQAAASVGLDAMAIPALPPGLGPSEGYASSGIPINSIGGGYDHSEWLTNRIREITGLSDADRRDQIAAQHISSLDPDLAVNRSFSLAFKVQEQKRRNFERGRSNHLRSLRRELANHLKSKLA